MHLIITFKPHFSANSLTQQERNNDINTMSPTPRRSGGIFEGIYKVFMRRTPVYVTFVILGALVGERAVDYGVHKLWEKNNVGKRFEDISVLEQKPSE